MKLTEQLAEAFTIFSKYEDDDVILRHEEICTGPEVSETSEEDANRLKELGWEQDVSGDCWFKIID